MGLGDALGWVGDQLGISGTDAAAAQQAALEEAARNAQKLSNIAYQNVNIAGGKGIGALEGYGGQAIGALDTGWGAAERALTGGRLGEMLGGQMYSGFEQDPGYQFRLQQGEQALNRSAAARGGRLGGAQLKALSDYSQGLASQEFGNFANRRQFEAGMLGNVAS